MKTTIKTKFLGTHDDSTQQPAPVPTAQPQASVPVSALPAILQASSNASADALRAELQLARELRALGHVVPVDAPPTAAPQASAPTPAAPTAPPTSDPLLQQLSQQMHTLQSQLAAERLETYRLAAIQRARSSGVELIDSLVMGRDAAEIDASIRIAQAEYQLVQQQVAAQLQQQFLAAQQATQQQLATQQGFVAAAAPPAAAQQPQFQPQVAPTGLPSFSAPAQALPTQGGGQQFAEQVRAVTTAEAIRSGAYAQQRQEILRSLRTGQLGLTMAASQVQAQTSPQAFSAPLPPAQAHAQAAQQQFAPLPPAQPQFHVAPQAHLQPPQQFHQAPTQGMPAPSGMFNPTNGAFPVSPVQPQQQFFSAQPFSAHPAQPFAVAAPQPAQLDAGQVQLTPQALAAARQAAIAASLEQRAVSARTPGIH